MVDLTPVTLDPPSGTRTRLWFKEGDDRSVTVELADGRQVVARP